MQAAGLLQGAGPRPPPEEEFHVQQTPRGQAVLQPLAAHHRHPPVHGHCCLEQRHVPNAHDYGTSLLAAQQSVIWACEWCGVAGSTQYVEILCNNAQCSTHCVLWT